jgi:hypothetical protein
MGRWTGEAISMPVGPKWTYKLRLEEQTEVSAQSHLVLGGKLSATEQEARSAGEAHLKEEIERRSS